VKVAEDLLWPVRVKSFSTVVIVTFTVVPAWPGGAGR
jgi:hypothetical protein